MRKLDLEDMDFDELWLVHEELTKILAEKIGAEKLELEKRLAQQNIQVEVDKAARKLIASEGYDPQFGARPLKRAIQELLLDPLATKILDGDFLPGDHLKVKAETDHLIFTK